MDDMQKLRAVHVHPGARLEQLAVLTPEQISEYAERRGYHAAPEPGHGRQRQH